MGQKTKDLSNINENPEQFILDDLIKNFSMDRFDFVFKEINKLLSDYPRSFKLWNILGAVNTQMNKIQDAMKCYQKTISLQPDYAEAHNNLGIVLQDQGKLKEAIGAYKRAIAIGPDFAEAYNNMGTALQDQGNLQEAMKSYNKAISIKPNYANAYNNMGTALKKQGNLDKAVVSYSKALVIKPDYAEAYNNLGIALKKQGNLVEALEAYNKALFIKPYYSEALNNMGVALKNQGKLKEAIETYKNAISTKPDYTDAYYNMGIALQDQGKLEEAIQSYKKVLSIKPYFVEVYNNMGVVFKDQGKLEEAMNAYNKALVIKPNYAEVYNNMGVALTNIIFKKPNRDLQNTISSLLDKKLHARPTDIAAAAISLLKFEPGLQKQLKFVSDDKVIQDPLNIISDLSELPLLLKLISVCPLPDLELEKLLKRLRASILENISSFKEASPELLRFQSALALQCFTNEYVYSQTKNEEKAIRVLEKQIKELLSNNEQPSPQMILILASYKALHKYDWCQSLIVTNQIQDVFTRQVEEPNQEEKLKLNIPILEEINNKVSSKVREQYEESPYPRWVNLGLNLEPAPISKVVEELQLKLHYEKINEVKKPDILIAGCGTGQHSISTAAMFKSSKVLAIDLSLSSLAYAKRKTEELHIENIDYMQADILDLGQLNKQFDIIESVGVLHHMDNPMKGWKVLTDCLKPGGLMRIGLYSELARQHIVKIREEISQTGIGSSNAEMRSFRETIMRSDEDHHKLTIKFPDFYSLSELRDLLFHVKEHRFTIPLIKDHLDKLGLSFCGFETEKVLSHFKLSYTRKEDPYNLLKWQIYEEANPRAFSGMYQFWCQKTL